LRLHEVTPWHQMAGACSVKATVFEANRNGRLGLSGSGV